MNTRRPDRERGKDVVQMRVNRLVNEDLQTYFRGILTLDELPHVSSEAHPELIWGKVPDAHEMITVGKRQFGVELYRAKQEAQRGILVVAQHGYSGRARDWSRLAEQVNVAGIDLLAVDMHASGRNKFEQMSMRIDEWAQVATESLHSTLAQEAKAEQKFFVGQSSGGTAGAEIAIRNHSTPVFNGALLIGPTLITVNPDIVVEIERIVRKHAKGKRDAMIDGHWLWALTGQCQDPQRNAAYQHALSEMPGFPFNAAREAVDIPRARLIEHLDAIDIPVILVRGENDQEDRVSLGVAQEELNGKHTPIVIGDPIPQAAHQAHIDNPEAIAALIEQLIQRAS